jgi:hypothetical protein
MKRKGPKRIEKDPSKKKLNYTFEELVNEDPLDVFSVLTSDQFWEDIGSKQMDDVSVFKEISENIQFQEPEICRESALGFNWNFEFKPDELAVEMQPESDRIELIVNDNYSDHEAVYKNLFRYEYPFCLIFEGMAYKKQNIEFSSFLNAFLKCVSLKRHEQAMFAIRIFYKNQPKLCLESEKEPILLELILRLIMDPEYSSLTQDLLFLLKMMSTSTSITKSISVVCRSLSGQLEGYPYRSMVCGNFFSLASHECACVFYDCLLNDGDIYEFEDYLCDAVNVDYAELGDVPKFTERLLLLASRLACTSEIHDSNRILRHIRRLKSSLPKGMVAKALGVQEALTRISGFLIATEPKKLQT